MNIRSIIFISLTGQKIPMTVTLPLSLSWTIQDYRRTYHDRTFQLQSDRGELYYQEVL